jgi:uncharacterized membrane protein
MKSQHSGTNFNIIIAGIIAVFLGFILVIVLLAQASILDATNGSVTLANSGLFFGIIFLALICVLLGGYLVGKYVEKMREERRRDFSPPPPST